MMLIRVVVFVGMGSRLAYGFGGLTLLEKYPKPPEWLRNLIRLLDLVNERPEIRQSHMAVASTPQLYDEWFDRYFSAREVDVYRTSLTNLSSELMNGKSRLTWIIFTNAPINLKSYGGNRIWNSRDTYVIVYLGKCEEEVNDVFASLWQSYGVTKVMLSSPCDHFKSFVRYLPFAKSDQNAYGVVERVPLEQYLESSEFDSREISETKSASKQRIFFEDFQDLNGYSLNVSIFTSLFLDVRTERNGKIIFSGVERSMIETIRHALNATFFYISGTKTYNLTDPFYIALNSLSRGDSELILTAYFQKPYSFGGLKWLFEFTATDTKDELCVVVPAAGLVPKYIFPLLPFTAQLWTVLIVSSFALNALCAYIGQIYLAVHRGRCMPERITFGTLRRYSYLFIKWCFQVRRPESCAERIMVASTFLAGIVISGAYQSALVSSLNKPFRKSDLKTLEDLVDSELLIGSTYANLIENTFAGDSPTMEKLRTRSRIFNEISSTPYETITLYKNLSWIGRASENRVAVFSKYRDKEGNHLLHLLEECPANYFTSYVVRWASPYLERLNNLLLRIEEAGLHKQWVEEYHYKIQLMVSKTRDDTKRKIVLSLEYFRLEFVGLLIGLSASILLFVGETYFWYKMKKKRVDNPQKQKIPLGIL